MVRWKFWEKQPPNAPEPVSQHTPVAAPNAKGFVTPAPRFGSAGGQRDDDSPQRARLNEREAELEREIAKAEEAASANSVFHQRLEVIEEALATVNTELDRLTTVSRRNLPASPPVAVTDFDVSIEDPPAVSFIVGDRRFHYEEEIDWAERGTNVVRGDLVRREGDLNGLPVDDVLRDHLMTSLFVLATDLRNRTLEQQPLPSGVTLADLSRPCPACGEYLDWTGSCQACNTRDTQRRRLMTERDRLLSERSSLQDERSELVDRLPVLRHRLADVRAAQEGLRDHT